MTADDLGRVLEIAARASQAPNWPRAVWLDALAPNSVPRRIALVAIQPESGAVTGFAVASPMPPQAELESIAVVPAAQRRGVARHLFGALLAEFAPKGVTEVLLEVRASNHPALALYRTLGFAETGRRPRYYADPVEDAVLMNLRLR